MAYRYRRLDSLAKMLASEKFNELPDWQQIGIIEELELLRRELIAGIKDYEFLWLKKNKYPKLDYNLNRLERQVAELSNFITLAKAGDLVAYQEPEAVWFWYPDAEPTKKTKPGEKYFMRVFNIDKEPVLAEIKCWADDKATIFVNGEKVIEAIYGKPAVTANILPLLKIGKNHLAIEGYNTIGPAGILLNLTVKFSDKTSIIITGDDNWFVSEKAKWHWKKREPKGKNWKKVKLLGKGLIEPWKSINW